MNEVRCVYAQLEKSREGALSLLVLPQLNPFLPPPGWRPSVLRGVAEGVSEDARTRSFASSASAKFAPNAVSISAHCRRL